MSSPYAGHVHFPATEPVLQFWWIIVIALVGTILMLSVVVILVIIKTKRSRHYNFPRTQSNHGTNEGFERGSENLSKTITPDDVRTIGGGET